MFLRNYDNYMAALFLSDVKTYKLYGYGFFAAENTTYFQDGFINLRTTNGKITDVKIIYSSEAISSPGIMSEGAICLGDGDTPVTYDDYALSGASISNKLVRISRTKTWDSENKKWVVKLVCGYENTGTTDIVIKEWGLMHGISSSYIVYGINQYITLMFREVLEEPITIPAGESATIHFTLDVPMPNMP